MLRIYCAAAFAVLLTGCTDSGPASYELTPIDPASWEAEAILPDYSEDREGLIFRATLGLGGTELFFFEKVTPGAEDYRIMTSVQTASGWSEPSLLSVDGREESDMYPVLSPDGSHMLFTSYRDIGSDYPNANLWMTSREGNAWSAPELLAEASTPAHYESGPTFAPDGAIRFKSISPDWRTTYFRTASPSEEGYGAWTQDDLLASIPRDTTTTYLWTGVINPQGDTVILEMADVSEGERPGPSDLWVSQRTEDGWTPAERLPVSINTEGVENFPIFSSDGRYLLFVRDFTHMYRVALMTTG